MLPIPTPAGRLPIQTSPRSIKFLRGLVMVLFAISIAAVSISKENETLFVRSSSQSHIDALHRIHESAVYGAGPEVDEEPHLSSTCDPASFKQVDAFSDGGYYYYELLY